MDKLTTYLNCINDYNNTFSSNVSNYFYILEISREDIYSNDDLLNRIFNITDADQQHNAELIQLKGFENPLKNFIKDNMYSGLIDYFSFNINNKSDKAKFLKGLGIKHNSYSISIENRIQQLESNSSNYNDVTNNFFKMLINYSGIPEKIFFIKSDPNFYIALFNEDILLKYKDKYLFLSFCIDD